MEQPLHVTVKKAPLLSSSFCEYMQHSGPGEDTEEETATTLQETGADRGQCHLVSEAKSRARAPSYHTSLGTSATSDIHVIK